MDEHHIGANPFIDSMMIKKKLQPMEQISK